MRILADASLPGLATFFPAPWEVTPYHNAEEVQSKLAGQDILLCRSTLPVTESLIGKSSLKFVATASSGRDHLDELGLAKHGIAVLDAKGTNAEAVADYVVATLASLKHSQGITPKRVGIIGLGLVGMAVYRRLNALDIELIAYDPLKAAGTEERCDKDKLLQCDLLTIHANLHDAPPYPSRHLIDAPFIQQLKAGTVLVNAARGGIVDEDALLQYGEHLHYCTDVYQGEPDICAQLIAFATVCTPHIAGHSIEAKQQAVRVLSQKLGKHYQLTAPCDNEKSTGDHTLLSHSTDWSEGVLSLYNPLLDTTQLKAADSKRDAFLTLRRQHTHRHDFRYYDANHGDTLTRALLGHLD